MIYPVFFLNFDNENGNHGDNNCNAGEAGQRDVLARQPDEHRIDNPRQLLLGQLGAEIDQRIGQRVRRHHLVDQRQRLVDLQPGEEAAWVILLEAELRALDHYEPVLGLPDTLKAKLLMPLREQWTSEAAGRTMEFDFIAPLEALKASQTTNWKPLRAEDAANPKAYPVLDAEAAAAFRAKVRQEMVTFIRTTFPSLKDSDKPEPAADWSKGA
mgnify:CR=1 FL=1